MADSDPTARGMTTAMLGGLRVMAFLVLRYRCRCFRKIESSVSDRRVIPA